MANTDIHPAFSLTPIYHEVVIIGAGISGICMGAQLKRKFGVTDIVILEKEDGIAGTWSSNRYPACACDVPAPVYSFSFRQKTDWSTFYPKQVELKSYFNLVATEFGLLDKFHLKACVLEARFDESTNLWHVAVDEAGKQYHYVCKLFVSAVGGLSTPKECDIKGYQQFEGPLFHSARWDHSVDLKGKNVVVVGNGCSATQFVPIIAEQVKTLTQAVRSKHWYEKPPHNPFSLIPGWTWLIKNVPFFMYLQRFLIWCVLESHFTIILLNPMGKLFRLWWTRASIRHTKNVAPKKYWSTLLPSSSKELQYGCKRRILDDKYLACLHRDNVQLETNKIVEIGKDHVKTADGRSLEADVIIMANGFRIDRAGFPMKVFGRGNVEITEHWKEFGGGGPVSYRSTLMNGFPNYVNINGVNSATGHNSVIFTSENQVLYSLELAKPILQSSRPSQEAISHLPLQSPLSGKPSTPSFEAKASAEHQEQVWINKSMHELVFTTGCGSWYQNDVSNRVTAMYPDWQWKFMIRSIWPEWNDLKYTGLPNDALIPSTVPWWKYYGNKYLRLGSIPYVDPKRYPINPEKKKKVV